ncbi:MAG: response regulator [Methyloceanibacter sp.]
MRLREMVGAGAGTILIAVRDGELADSLRFSLELEGFGVRLYDEFSLLDAVAGIPGRGCLVIDQAVFARLADGGPLPVGRDLPVVLMVGQNTERVAARARAAGVSKVVETPLFGGALSDAIKAALEDWASRAAPRRS